MGRLNHVYAAVAFWRSALFAPSRLAEIRTSRSSIMLALLGGALPLLGAVIWRGESFGYWLSAATLLASLAVCRYGVPALGLCLPLLLSLVVLNWPTRFATALDMATLRAPGVWQLVGALLLVGVLLAGGLGGALLLARLRWTRLSHLVATGAGVVAAWFGVWAATGSTTVGTLGFFAAVLVFVPVYLGWVGLVQSSTALLGFVLAGFFVSGAAQNVQLIIAGLFTSGLTYAIGTLVLDDVLGQVAHRPVVLQILQRGLLALAALTGLVAALVVSIGLGGITVLPLHLFVLACWLIGYSCAALPEDNAGSLTVALLFAFAGFDLHEFWVALGLLALVLGYYRVVPDYVVYAVRCLRAARAADQLPAPALGARMHRLPPYADAVLRLPLPGYARLLQAIARADTAATSDVYTRLWLLQGRGFRMTLRRALPASVADQLLAVQTVAELARTATLAHPVLPAMIPLLLASAGSVPPLTVVPQHTGVRPEISAAPLQQPVNKWAHRRAIRNTERRYAMPHADIIVTQRLLQIARALGDADVSNEARWAAHAALDVCRQELAAGDAAVARRWVPVVAHWQHVCG